jgi:GNAT superfamily N-acetyltransferase
MSEIRFVPLGAGEYDRAKTVLNKAKHPGFVGRELFYRCATAGQAVMAVLVDGETQGDVGVGLAVKGKFHVLSIVPSAQGFGVGSRLVDHMRPEWANVIMDRVPWFEKRGYQSVGAPKVGQSGKMATQLMQRIPDFEPGAPVTDAGELAAHVKTEAAAPAAQQAQAAESDEPYDPDGAPPEDPDSILNTALRCMRRHLEAIETGGASGRLLVMDQPGDIAGFVRALGGVSTKKKKRADDELGGKSLNELLTEAMKSPSLRPALMAALGEDGPK